MGRILLATDGSEYARQAAERAIRLAEDRGDDLHVLCVVDRRRFDAPALSSTELVTIEAGDRASALVSEVAELAADRDVAVEGATRHGVPHEVILEYAAEVDADVIVVGEHGDHREHFSGVGERVRELADRTVLVVEAAGQV